MRQQHRRKPTRYSQWHVLQRRRQQFGELIQVDGSPHQWFVQDPTLYTLLLFVDDATGIITAARFEKSETFTGYAQLIEEHVWRYGIPVSFYSDRHSVFCPVISEKEATKNIPEKTQYQRVCDTLGIHPILAYSPQAKGRIERMNQTLQKRWPGEFAARGITTPQQANQRMPELLAFLISISGYRLRTQGMLTLLINTVIKHAKSCSGFVLIGRKRN